jgi:hypothetical protein
MARNASEIPIDTLEAWIVVTVFGPGTGSTESLGRSGGGRDDSICSRAPRGVGRLQGRACAGGSVRRRRLSATDGSLVVSKASGATAAARIPGRLREEKA